ncbi:MAG: TlpA disulfide reductase family protein [Bacteroidota bacterium]
MDYRTIILLLSYVLLFASCSEKEGSTPHQYLKEVLSNLEEIESATYDSYGESWAPGDTVPSVVSRRYYKAFNNPTDTTLGASWVVWNGNDTTQLAFAYDGKMRAIVYEEKKGIVIDSFNVRKLPFRPVSTPFYQYTRDILEYALTTQDSISLNFDDLGDTVHVEMIIHEDRQVEFFGKAHYIPEPPYGYQDPTSQYELWIDRVTNLPYKYRREMEHNISAETVTNARFNTMNITDFVAASYFPADYEIRQYGDKRKVASPHKLLGKRAPEWILTNEYGEKVGLNELKSKVVLVQFTSVNCGPCRASIPFLNKLSSVYNSEDFSLVAIESYTGNTNVLSTYRKRTGLNYQFLMSEKKVNSDYNIRATPIFFVLDENRIIKEIFSGYGGASTDKEITETINQLI